MAASDDSEEESEPSERGTNNSSNEARAPRKVRRRNRVDRQKLIIILVGLPGRGKTFLCNKLMCYLNWYASAWLQTARVLDKKHDCRLYSNESNILKALHLKILYIKK